jgi:hypothetical protein
MFQCVFAENFGRLAIRATEPRNDAGTRYKKYHGHKRREKENDIP